MSLLALIASLSLTAAAEPPSCAGADCAGSASHATRVGRTPDLLSGSCSYSTARLIERVLRKGTVQTYVGRLRPAERLENKVAAPFVLGPDEVRVLANARLDELVADAPAGERVVQVVGRVLEEHGVRYFVITEVVPPSS